jgi:hypothetical protein
MTLADARAPRLPAPGSRGARGAAAAADPAAGSFAADLRRARLPWPVALYLLAVVLPVWFQAGPLALSLLRLLLLVLVVPLAFRLMAGRFGRLMVSDVFFVLYLLWTIVSLAVNNPDRVIESAGSSGIEFIGAYLLGRGHIRDRAAFAALCRWVATLAMLLLPVAAYEAVTGHAIVLELIDGLPGIDSIGKVTTDPRLGLTRAQTVFEHPIHHGLFCSVGLSLALVGLKGTWSLPRRLVTAGLVLAAGFFALSSGALLAMILQLFLIAWAVAFAGNPRRWWLLVGLIALLYVAIDILSDRTPIRVFMSYATFSAATAFGRAIIFESGMQNVWANPVFGLGLRDWVRSWMLYTDSVDNFWLLTAMRFGIPGFSFLVIGYVALLVQLMRRDFAADPVLSQFRLAWVFTFVGLTFTLVTVHIWATIYSFVFFLFGAGAWLAAAQPAAAGTPAAAPVPARGPAGPRYSRFAPRPAARPPG